MPAPILVKWQVNLRLLHITFELITKEQHMDTQHIIKDISAIFDAVVETIENTDNTTINTIPFENSWTIGQVAEHIVICSRGVQDNRTGNADRAYDEKLEQLRAIFLNMEQKSKAAPGVTPHPPPHQTTRLIDQLAVNKRHLLAIAAERDLTKLSLDMEFPYMGYLTRYEWLSFICLHTQRHLNQIRNIQQQLFTTAKMNDHAHQ